MDELRKHWAQLEGAGTHVKAARGREAITGIQAGVEGLAAQLAEASGVPPPNRGDLGRS